MAWSYIATGTAVADLADNITLGTPAGTSSGDLFVAIIAYKGTVAFTLPSGWTQIENQNTGNTNSDSTGKSSILMAYIVRGGSVPSMVFTRTGGDIAHGACIAYRSDAGGISLGEHSSNTHASAVTTATTGTISTAAANQLIVAGYAGGDNGTADAFDAATDPATASGTAESTAAIAAAGTWTLRTKRGTNTGTDTAVSIAEALRATAGATGTIQSTAAVSALHSMCAAVFGEATNYVLTAAQGAFTLAGQAANLLVARKLTAEQGSFSLSGQAATLTFGYGLTAAAGSFALTGQAASFSRTYRLAAETGLFSLTGQAAGLRVGRLIQAAYGAFTLSGQAATLTYGSGGEDYPTKWWCQAFVKSGV